MDLEDVGSLFQHFTCRFLHRSERKAVLTRSDISNELWVVSWRGMGEFDNMRSTREGTVRSSAGASEWMRDDGPSLLRLEYAKIEVMGRRYTMGQWIISTAIEGRKSRGYILLVS